MAKDGRSLHVRVGRSREPEDEHGDVARLLESPLLEPPGSGIASSSTGRLEAFDCADERRIGSQLLGSQVDPLVLPGHGG
jgi:hypothetical protein